MVAGAPPRLARPLAARKMRRCKPPFFISWDPFGKREMTAAIRHPNSCSVAPDSVAGRVVATIAAEIRPERIYLFGSRASGTAGPESDVDVLLVYAGKEAPREVQLKAQRLFRKPAIPLDVFVLSPEEFESQKRVANTLAREVSETGIRCHG